MAELTNPDDPEDYGSEAPARATIDPDDFRRPPRRATIDPDESPPTVHELFLADDVSVVSEEPAILDEKADPGGILLESMSSLNVGGAPAPSAAPGLPSYYVPSVATDRDTSPDRLGRAADARAIAGLIASTALEPPLAIGLFGAWGSGKTHFMNQISREIGVFKDSGSSEMHANVREVRFNAWHYAEHNLWASLLQHVWSSLSPQKDWAQEHLTKALAEVEGARHVTEQAQARAQQAADAVSAAEAQVTEAKRQRDAALEEAAKLRLSDLRELADLTDSSLGAGASAEIGELKAAAKSAGVDVSLDSPLGLVDALAQVRALTGSASSLALTRPYWRSPMVVGAFFLILIGGGGLWLGQVAHDHSHWLGNAVAAGAQVAAVVAATAGWLTRRAATLRGLLAPTLKLQSRVDARTAAARAVAQAEVEAALRQADAAAIELHRAQADLLSAVQRRDEATAEAASLKGKRLLERYLADRAGAADYQQYLGLVALAHRDLENLGNYLLAAAAEDKTATGRVSIERIVLYIDDLDRCSPETVAHVLEAVHLLLALKLFVVVVGVDRRWLDRSLLASHTALLAPVDGEPATLPRDYLDKIFHLTYTLPAMTGDGARSLLDSLLPTSEPTETAPPRAQAAAAREALAALRVTDGDRVILDQLTPLLTSSPRRVSRFLSTYLVVRARSVSDALPIRQENAESVGGLATLVAFIFGVPGAAQDLIKTTTTVDDLTLGAWIDNWLPMRVDDVGEEVERVAAFATGATTLSALRVASIVLWWPVARSYTTFALGSSADPAEWAGSAVVVDRDSLGDRQ